MPAVYAGGDVGKGPGAIIDAIAEGRKAATAIDRLLGGEGISDETLAERPDTQSYTGERERGFADLERGEPPLLPLSERHSGFQEVDQCLDDEQAVREAKRCLQCDLEWRLIHEGKFNS